MQGLKTFKVCHTTAHKHQQHHTTNQQQQSTQTVEAGFDECSKTEANVEDGSAKFTTQNDTVLFVGSSDQVEWQYNALRVGTDVCTCATWQVAHSTTSDDVWNMDDRPISMSCKVSMLEPASMLLAASEWFMFGLPFEMWFWLSVKEIGASSSTNTVETALEPICVCIMNSTSIAPKLSYDKIVMIGSKAVVVVWWDDAQFRAQQCDQPAQLVIEPINDPQASTMQVEVAQNNTRIVLDESHLGTTATSCSLSLQVGTPNVVEEAVFDVVRCKETQGTVIVVDEEQSKGNNTSWHGVWQTQWQNIQCLAASSDDGGGVEVDWAKECVVVVDVVFVSIEHGTVLNKTSMTAQPNKANNGTGVVADVRFEVSDNEEREGKRGAEKHRERPYGPSAIPSHNSRPSRVGNGDTYQEDARLFRNASAVTPLVGRRCRGVGGRATRGQPRPSRARRAPPRAARQRRRGRFRHRSRGRWRCRPGQGRGQCPPRRGGSRRKTPPP